LLIAENCQLIEEITMINRAALSIGVLLILVGLLLMLVIVPSMKQFPEDVDTTRIYHVEYLTLLNGETLQFVSIPEGDNPDLRIERHFNTEEVDDGKALVREEQTIFNAEESLTALVKYYTIDRKTMEIVEDVPAAWKEHDGYWQREGIVMGWPIDSEEKDYTGWSDDYHSTVPLEYVRQEEHGGINTYYFTSEGTTPRPIDATYAQFLGLPAQLSITSVGQLASTLDSPDVELTIPQKVLLIGLIQDATIAVYGEPSEGELMIPLEYAYDYTAEYWVEPKTGVLIDTRKYEHRAASFPQDLMDKFKELASEREEGSAEYIPPDTLEKLMPITVSEYVYQGTEQTLDEARQDAEDAISQLQLFGTIIPLVLIVLGVLVGGYGVYGMRRRTA
jgi:hypothetical protein